MIRATLHNAGKASMRPRRFRRGEVVELSVGDVDPVCFNEAPAIPPGREGSGIRPCLSLWPRFNEAPAIPPGRGSLVANMSSNLNQLQ